MSNKLHPELKKRIEKVLTAMESLGFPMKIVQGVRTSEYQNTLYQIGRRGKQGEKIVTNADGFNVKSNHQKKADGFGHAVDCAFIVNNEVVWDDNLPWETYGSCCKAVGLRWGIKIGDWIDRPHAEWL